MKDTRGVNHLEINCASADGKPDITYYIADDTSGKNSLGQSCETTPCHMLFALL